MAAAFPGKTSVVGAIASKDKNIKKAVADTKGLMNPEVETATKAVSRPQYTGYRG